MSQINVNTITDEAGTGAVNFSTGITGNLTGNVTGDITLTAVFPFWNVIILMMINHS